MELEGPCGSAAGGAASRQPRTGRLAGCRQQPPLRRAAREGPSEPELSSQRDKPRLLPLAQGSALE
eukprot:3971756-Alexandrium_andersonii.AAC.1